MRTFVDTSALIALLYPDDDHNKRASYLLGKAYDEGSIYINAVVYAELAADPFFESRDHLDTFLEDTGISVEKMETESLFRAGKYFQMYLQNRGEALQCPSCGEKTHFECPDCGRNIQARQHIPSDFLIGSCAEKFDRLLTFDRGFFGEYFEIDQITTVQESTIPS